MVNKVTLIGRVGKDVEFRAVGSTFVAEFSLATDESYKDKEGNWQNVTEWHNIKLWGDLAERANKQISKGMLIYLDGKNKTETWKKEEVTYSKATVVGNIYRILNKNENSDTKTATSTPQMETADSVGGDNTNGNDLPF